MRVLLIFILISSVFGCSDTDLGQGLNVTSPTSDTTAPTLSGVITVSTDAGISQSATGVWPVATDSVGVDRYEIAIAVDNSSGTCTSDDFSGSLTLGWTTVPGSADFSGGGYQVINAALDGDNAAISLNLLGSTDYCMAVRAVDAANNQSDPIYSTTWSFLYNSCLQKKTNEPSSTDGVNEIDPDGVGGNASFNTFCDMTTQGGGWTLVIKYDSAQAAAGAYALDANAGRSAINQADLSSINASGNLTASTDIRPFVTNGATHFMHVGKTNDAATDSTTYVRFYFSDIYQAVIDTPANLFDSSLDTNASEGLSGTDVSPTSAVRKDHWYEADFSVMTAWDSDGSTSTPHRIDGGEGDAMFTNGNREGAVYCSGSVAGLGGHTNPKVQWGFRGKDGTQQSYGGTIFIGTYCSSGFSCAPESAINMMFVR